jgi:crotonobetainyl-CoA:carnitine CoA-transferase CaiB-like acyl-CoA transferase
MHRRVATSHARLPLAGVRILDLTSVVIGPVCTWRLGQYGAEIIKIEAPEGDLMRGLGGLSPTGEHSGAYLHMNRGKRNVCLDLKQPGSRAVMSRLVASADVIVSNIRPAALARLGLDAATVRAAHPEKIYCQLTGYGSDGPYAGRAAYDSVLQGGSGIAGLFAARDGAPAYVPMLLCDHVVGEIAAGAILAALAGRTAGDGGCTLEIPMFETMAAFVLQEHLGQQSFDPAVGPGGDRRLLNRHNKPLQTADGWVSVTMNTDTQVKAFLRAVGRDEVLDDPRFATVAARAKHVDEWFEVRGGELSSKTTAEWLAIFEAADIPAMPCHTLETLRTDPHLEAVGLLNCERHVTEGNVSTIRSTIRRDDAHPPIGSQAQPRGWETRKVLEEIGVSAGEIDDLLRTGAAVEAQR